jgi:hypothetical protein
MDDFDRVDDFLAASHRIGLEEVLSDGCLTGRVRVFLADVASIAPTMVQSERDDDGGLSATYEGTLTVEGVAYRFRCHVFIDRGGDRFLSDVSEFRAVEWQTRIAVRR